MGLFGSSNDGGAAADEAQRQAQIAKSIGGINNEFAGFTPEFYEQAAKDYTNFATPQVMDQFTNTRNNLTAALGRNNLLKSSAATQENAGLNKELGVQEAQIANNAQGQSNQLQSQVANQKSQLISEAQSGENPTALNEAAQGAVSQLKEPTALQPLGQLFSDWSQQFLGSQTAAVNNNQSNSLNSSLASILGNQGVGTASPAGGSSYYVQ